MTIHIKYVQCGINYNNKQVLRSAIVQGYAEAVNNFFKLRNFSPPADLSDPNNMTAIILNTMLQEEDIARQRAPPARYPPPNKAKADVLFKSSHDDDVGG